MGVSVMCQEDVSVVVQGCLICAKGVSVVRQEKNCVSSGLSA